MKRTRPDPMEQMRTKTNRYLFVNASAQSIGSSGNDTAVTFSWPFPAGEAAQ